jgi:hypothetical protein
MSSSSTTHSSPVRGQSSAIFPRSFSLWHLVVHQEQIQNEIISSLWHFKNRNNLPKESNAEQRAQLIALLAPPTSHLDELRAMTIQQL